MQQQSASLISLADDESGLNPSSPSRNSRREVDSDLRSGRSSANSSKRCSPSPRSTPTPPSRPPPPLPNEEEAEQLTEEMLPSIRRRSKVSNTDKGSSDNGNRRRAVRFQTDDPKGASPKTSPKPSISSATSALLTQTLSTITPTLVSSSMDSSTTPANSAVGIASTSSCTTVLSNNGGKERKSSANSSKSETSSSSTTVVSQLVRKSSAMLKTLTLNLTEKNELDALAKQASTDGTSSEEASLADFKVDTPTPTQTPTAAPEAISLSRAKMSDDKKTKVDDESSSDESEEEEEEAEEEEEEEDEESESTDYEEDHERKHTRRLAPCDHMFYSLTDPPDPVELKKLPKVRKRPQTLAVQWRKKRERERAAMGITIGIRKATIS